jgi:hypothetical protein
MRRRSTRPPAAFLTRLGFTSHGPWTLLAVRERRWAPRDGRVAARAAHAAVGRQGCAGTTAAHDGARRRRGYLDLRGGFRITPYRDTAEEVEQMVGDVLSRLR